MRRRDPGEELVLSLLPAQLVIEKEEEEEEKGEGRGEEGEDSRGRREVTGLRRSRGRKVVGFHPFRVNVMVKKVTEVFAPRHFIFAFVVHRCVAQREGRTLFLTQTLRLFVVPYFFN